MSPACAASSSARSWATASPCSTASSAGERVVVSGATLLVDGEAVRVDSL